MAFIYNFDYMKYGKNILRLLFSDTYHFNSKLARMFLRLSFTECWPFLMTIWENEKNKIFLRN